MRVLITGASSFTGYWFAKTLAEAGHEVVATFQKDTQEYYGDDRHSQRTRNLFGVVSQLHFSCPFGGRNFLSLQGPYDLLCLHGAYVGDYKSQDYDTVAAVAKNTRNIAAVLEGVRLRGCHAVVATGTYFEPDEFGVGSLTPYGDAKAATFEFFKYWCDVFELKLGKFVIPNPFGPYEETTRWCAKAVQAWKNGETAILNTPSYVRDNIHVDYLAYRYRIFCEQMINAEVSSIKCTPSGYVESMGDFTTRLAREVGTRLGLNCKTEIKETGYSEPISLYNNDDPLAYLEWSSTKSWDRIAEFYKQF